MSGLDAERVAAAAGVRGVRVLDLEPGLAQVVNEVDSRTEQVDRALGVHDDPDALLLGLLVQVIDLIVEHQLVLEAAAPAAHDLEAQGEAVATVPFHELLDLLRSGIGQVDDLHRLLNQAYSITIFVASSIWLLHLLVPPAGIELASLGSKPSTLSIELQGLIIYLPRPSEAPLIPFLQAYHIETIAHRKGNQNSFGNGFHLRLGLELGRVF
jgi:hypothetical protein